MAALTLNQADFAYASSIGFLESLINTVHHIEIKTTKNETIKGELTQVKSKEIYFDQHHYQRDNYKVVDLLTAKNTAKIETIIELKVYYSKSERNCIDDAGH
jgi:hypothetical protein